MSVIRWLVVQEVCSGFEFARHFESHLTRPPPFYMRMQTRGEPIMLKNLPIMLCRSARKRYLLCSTFVRIMLNFFNYVHQNNYS